MTPTPQQQPKRIAEVPMMGKYDEVLVPFKHLMESELHANAGKGDRPGWLSMTAEQCLLEIYYHVSKLQKAVRDGNGDRIKENTADVANMAMMLADICGALEMARPSDGTLTNEGAEPVAWQDPLNEHNMCTAEHKRYAITKGGAPATALEPLTVPLYRRPPAPASVVLPPAPTLPEEPPFADDDSYMDAYNAAHRMRTACAEAIAAAGIGLRFEP